MSQELQDRIEKLEALVVQQSSQLKAHEELLQKQAGLIERQSQLIAKTGQQLVGLQVDDIKTRMKQIDPTPQVDMDDYIKNEDIIQLVGELQGQLDTLEERNIARVINYNNENIVPLTNKNGEFPDALNFPKTLSEFVNIKDSDLIQLGLFYELIVSNDQINELNNLIKNDTADADVKQILFNQSGSENLSSANEFSKEEISELFDELSRYLGLKLRKNEK